jgi:phosphoribosylaminoimidazole-succinocarboxamide synthase
MKLLHRGSVKDIYQSSPGELIFRFSNRYSIFDWGEMPDQIPGKGAELAKMGAVLLNYLQKEGIPTHYIGQGETHEDLVVREVKVPRDGVEIYQQRPSSTLIPLEVIYRFGAPQGSSLIRKLKTEADWKLAGFDRAYREGEEFSSMAMDFTTKLEKLDRPLTKDEAKQLAGMNDSEWKSLIAVTQTIAKKLKIVFEVAGLKLWDGKLEFAFDENRNIMLVDSIGLDEIRLTFEGQTLSKELLRQCYLHTNWYRALTIAKEKVPARFKEYCIDVLHESPAQLPVPVIQAMSDIYQITASLILNSNPLEIKTLQQKLSSQLQILKGVS